MKGPLFSGRQLIVEWGLGDCEKCAKSGAVLLINTDRAAGEYEPAEICVTCLRDIISLAQLAVSSQT